MANYNIYNPPLDDADYPAKFDLFFPALTNDVTAVEVLSAANAAYIAAITTTGIQLDNAVAIILGTDSDTSISHTGANTDINHAALAAGDLRLIHDANIVAVGNTYINLLDNISLNFGTTTQGSILFDSANSELDITSTNIHLTGIVTTTGTLSLLDNNHLIVGTTTNLDIYNDGVGTSILSASDFLYIEATNGLTILNANTTATALIQSHNAVSNPITCISFGGVNNNVSLYYDNATKLETTSSGITITGGISLADSGVITFGNDTDLLIFHNGTNSYILNDNINPLIIQANNGVDIITSLLTVDSITSNTTNADLTLGTNGSGLIVLNAHLNIGNYKGSGTAWQITSVFDVYVMIELTGGTQGEAPVSAQICKYETVWLGGGNDAVTLDGSIGNEITIININATAALKVYPPVGKQINSLATNAVYTIPATHTCTFIQVTGTKWVVTNSTAY